MKTTPSCFPRRAGSKHVFLTWKVNLKIWPQVRSGQGQVMTQISQYANLPKRIDESSRLAPSACLYLHPVARLISENRIVTSFELIWSQVTSRTPDRQLHRDYHRWGEWPWSWKNWMVSVDLCGMRSIFIFPHRLITGRSWNWPDLRSPG